MHRKTSQSRFNSKILAAGFVLALIGGAVLVYKLNPLSLKEAEIEISGAPCLTAANLKPFLQQSVWDLGGDVRKDITRRYPCVFLVKVEHRLFNRTMVWVKGRTGLIKVGLYSPPASLDPFKEATPSSSAALLDWSFPEGNDDFFLVDGEGVVFGKDENANLGRLFLPEKIVLGGKLNDSLVKSVIGIIGRFDKLAIASTSGQQPLLKVSGNFLMMKNNQKIVFSVKKDILRQLVSLQLILQKAKIDERVIELVDLRFDKPVVIYGKRQSVMRD